MLQDGDFILTESGVIVDYLASKAEKERSAGGSSTPGIFLTEPLQRAQAAIFLDQVVGSKFIPAWYGILRTKEEDKQAATQDSMLQILARMNKFFAGTEGATKAGTGAFAFGSATPTSVDLMTYPWFERMGVLTHYKGFSIPADKEEYAALRAWVAAMQELPASKATSRPTDYYVAGYAGYV